MSGQSNSIHAIDMCTNNTTETEWITRLSKIGNHSKHKILYKCTSSTNSEDFWMEFQRCIISIFTFTSSCKCQRAMSLMMCMCVSTKKNISPDLIWWNSIAKGKEIWRTFEKLRQSLVVEPFIWWFWLSGMKKKETTKNRKHCTQRNVIKRTREFSLL